MFCKESTFKSSTQGEFRQVQSERQMTRVFDAIKIAIIKGDQVAINQFLKRTDFLSSIKYQNEFGNTLLHEASYQNPEVALNFLDHISHSQLTHLLNLQNKDGDTILHLAAKRKNIVLINILCELYHEEINFFLKNKENATFLDILISYGEEFSKQLCLKVQEEMKSQKEKSKLIEDFVHPGLPVIMSPNSFFRPDIDEVANDLGIDIHYIPVGNPDEDYVWFRDYFHTSFDSAGNIVTYATADKSAGIDYEECPVSQEDAILLIGNEKTIGTFKSAHVPPSLDESRPFLDDAADIVRRIGQGSKGEMLNALPAILRKQEKTIPLEGGNLIKTINNQGNLKFIVGESTLVHSAVYYRTNTLVGPESASYVQYRQAVSPDAKGFKKWTSSYAVAPEVDNPDQAFLLATRRISEKYRVAHELNQVNMGVFSKDTKRDVVIVPQWTYHVDLQMGYLGHGRVLVHSFKSALEFLSENKAQIIRELDELISVKAIKSSETSEDLFTKLLYINQELLDAYENSVVNEIVRKLEKHGLSVTKCCGNLFTGFPSLGYLSGELFGCFMNGLGGHSEKKGRDYFLTARSPLASFEKYFSTQVLQPLGIDCHFLNLAYSRMEEPFAPEQGDTQMTPEMVKAVNTVKAIGSDLGGSLRCQTAVADPAIVFLS